ncbi:MAG: hypothetical protein RL577_1611 [Bacteroidota bacterium]
MLRLRELHISTGSKSLLQLPALDFHPGRVHAIIGESGSGKSLLLLALMGLLSPELQLQAKEMGTSSEDWLNLDLHQWQQKRGRELGMVFQEPMTALNPQMKCGKQLLEAYRVHKPEMSQQEANEHCIAKLERAGLAGLAARVMESYPHELSGGQRQRVVIAMACMHDPAWVLADEPTTALDSFSRQAVMSDLQRMCQEQGSGLIWVSHELDIVTQMADDVSVLRQGELLVSGKIHEVLDAPNPHPYVSELLAALPQGKMPPKHKEDVVLDIQNLSKSYKKGASVLSVLKNLSIQVYRGETLVILGKSGSGKSTLAKLLTGLESIDSGSIIYNGQPLAAKGPTGIQMVFQDPYASLNPQVDNWYALAEILALRHGGKAGAYRRQAEEAMKQVQLPESLWAARPSQMSGGQRQRLCIARALVSEPDVLVLDEAVAALDPLVQASVLDLLKALQQRTGMVYVFITHDQAVARSMGHSIVYLEEGEVRPYS